MKEDVRFGSTSTDWGQSQQVCLPLTPEVGRAARDRREGPTTEAVLVCELNASVSPNVILCDVSGMALVEATDDTIVTLGSDANGRCSSPLTKEVRLVITHDRAERTSWGHDR